MTLGDGPVLEVQRWANNAELIEAMFDLHVWPKPWAKDGQMIWCLDPTFGKGKWWTWLTPLDQVTLVPHDFRQDGVDYRELPEADDVFDVVAFDPDYIAPGGRATSTIDDFNDRYGLKPEYETPAELQEMIDAGLAECARVVRPQGLIMQKCTNYISSGRLQLGEHWALTAGLSLGLVVEDIVVHLSDPGPQPKGRGQKHVRSNSSRLIIWRKPGRRKK